MENFNYVTTRNRNIRKSISCQSLDSEFDNSSNFSTPSQSSTKSLNISPNKNRDQILEMKNKIDSLTQSLESTQNELDTIIIENCELKKHITKLSTQLSALKTLCQSSPSSTKTNTIFSAKKKKPQKLLLPEQIVSDDLTSYAESSRCQTNISSSERVHTHITKSCDDSSCQELGQQCSKTEIKTAHITNTTDTSKVYIVGAAECIGISSLLKKIREKSPYKKYCFDSFLKPNACSEELIKTFSVFDIRQNDRIILCIGQCDNNPVKLMSELYNFLKTMHKICPILVLSVKENPYLNEWKLNNSMQTVCNCFSKNCHFVNINDTVDKYSMCKKLSSKLDQIDYNLQFLNFKNYSNTKINKKYNDNSILNYMDYKKKYLNNKSNKQQKQNTILHYFKKIDKNHYKNCIITAKKRTSQCLITSYFLKIEKTSQESNNRLFRA